MGSRGDGRMGRAAVLWGWIALAMSLAGCGGGADQPRPTGQSVDYRQYFLEPTGVQPDELPDPRSTGARLAVEFCSQCHGIPDPSSHSASDWRPILRNMFLRMDRYSQMGMMGGMMMGGGMMGMRPVMIPSAQEERDLASYYQAHALHAMPEGAIPAAGPGQELFTRTCSRCHALPDPAKYPAAQWPAVVARMRQHMGQMHVSGITDQQAQEIASYLEKATSAATASGP